MSYRIGLADQYYGKPHSGAAIIGGGYQPHSGSALIGGAYIGGKRPVSDKTTKHKLNLARMKVVADALATGEAKSVKAAVDKGKMFYEKSLAALGIAKGTKKTKK